MSWSRQLLKMFQPTCIFLVVILACSANGESSTCAIMGSPVNEAEAPWLVSILRWDRHACAGVIHSMKYIITAADCLGRSKNLSLKVRAGSFDQKGGSVLGVCKRIVHEKYSSKNYTNNVALLGLCKPLVESATIKKIDLLDKNPAVGDNVTSLGWGYLSLWNKVTTHCSVKPYLIQRKADVAVYNITSCAANRKRDLRRWGKVITEVDICTKKPKRLCSYDRGSPLLSGNSLVGILSKGDCSNKPDIFTSLVGHKDWLANKTKE